MIFSFIFTIFAALSYCLTLIGLFLININYSGGGIFEIKNYICKKYCYDSSRLRIVMKEYDIFAMNILACGF